jgi:hypothetical protein
MEENPHKFSRKCIGWKYRLRKWKNFRLTSRVRHFYRTLEKFVFLTELQLFIYGNTCSNHWRYSQFNQTGWTAEKKLIATLQKVLEPYKFEFYRGDSFQVYIRKQIKPCKLFCFVVQLPLLRKLRMKQHHVILG